MAEVRINEANMAAFLGPGGPVMEGVKAIGEQVRRSAAPRAPGTLGADIAVEVHGTEVRVGNTAAKPHAIFQHGGTGIRAKRENWPPGTNLPLTVIKPRHANVLRWEGGGEVHYAKFVRGVHSQPYLKDALEAVFARL